jgi:ABC-type transport system involved in multi-copper enzyme maturation permease subunit
MNSISSEFETGTIVPLLTKPVSRTMVFLGKLFAAFVIILVTYVILFVYGTLGASIVYGLQNNLQLVPLVLLGSVLSTFIWVAIILAVGSISKSTMIAALVGLGLFLGLLIGVQIVPVLAGPSPALNYVPGTGTSGMMNLTQGSRSIASGTDNIGLNLINYALYPSANVSYLKTNIQFVQGGSPQISQSFAYTEPMLLVVLRSIGVAFAYIFVFLLIAWYAFKRAQILE